jgi:hypothetical protein
MSPTHFNKKIVVALMVKVMLVIVCATDKLQSNREPYFTESERPKNVLNEITEAIESLNSSRCTEGSDKFRVNGRLFRMLENMMRDHVRTTSNWIKHYCSLVGLW